MKTGIATVSISGSLDEKLEAIAAAGFDGIEIFEQDFIAAAGSPREIGARVRDHGLEIMLFQPFRDFEGLPEPHRAKAFDRAERKFDVMQELGCDLILVCSSVHKAALGGIDRMAADFHELGERAAKRGLRVGYEALAWGRIVDDHRDAWEVVRRADHPNVGLVVDSFHTLGRKLDPDSIRSIPGDRIFFVQLADAPAIPMDLLYWSRHFRNMPGEGDLAVLDFVRAVAATGYDGPLSLEIFNDQYRGASAGAIAKDGRRALLNLMDAARRVEPTLTIDAPQMPARARVEGVAFVEFAANDSEAAPLRQTFAALGFHREGAHRAKSVEIWRQGDIRLVINTEATGFAHSAWLTHGTGVCDIGLSVANAAEATARAKALGATIFHQPVGPGELEIPAIRGVGGGVLHFIDEESGLSKVWDVEFDRSTATDAPGAGLTRIDHIAQTVAYEEMLSWSLFYRAIFEMDKTPMVDVIDPDGLVRSQAIESPDGALRLTFNGAETHRTLAGRFLADSFNSAVQHIAFASGDAFASAEALGARGFEALPIPENYYADLAARFDLDPALLARMRALNILYDADETVGEFFQFYSRPTPEGLFFEIVERRGGYNGYGAANAPFRIAAQKRFLRAKGMPRK